MPPIVTQPLLPIVPGSNPGLTWIRQSSGPADGPVVLLVHGWSYDINSFADVAPVLAAAGYRVIVPHLRG